MMPSVADRRHSAEELVRLYDQIAIPHFQRGLVWGPGSIALLLESLYWETPCGSILLWEPRDAASRGVALGDAPRFLVVDGQQRIRSLRDVFGSESVDKTGAPVDTDNEQVEEDGHGDDTVWCVNLARLAVPEFADKKGGRFRLFGAHKNPLLPGKDDTAPGLEEARRALLPLRWFIEHADQTDWLRAQSAGTTAQDAVLAVLANPAIIQRLQGIRTNRLFDVRVLGADQSLKEVVSAYNRINSAGKRVEAEERAFASLVSVTDTESVAERALKAFFDRTRSSSLRDRAQAGGAEKSSASDRDDLLHREKENRFGFKLFMRVFVINLAYHANRAIGSSSFSFDSIDPESLEADKDLLAPILESTVKVLVDVAGLLGERLHCDDFRTLPDTGALWPVFQVAIRFPSLLTDSPESLASVALRLVLADLKIRELLALVSEVNAASSPAEALAVFEGRELSEAKIAARVKRGVDGAQSATDRYALILYWLLRRHGARDFSYKENECPEPSARTGVPSLGGELALSADVTPEKQHLVPYSILKKLFELSGARPGKHEAHDIGNLTYISAFQNGFDCLSSTPLKLRAEPSGNLQAHFLDDEDVLDAFEDVCQATRAGSSKGRKRALVAYRKMCKKRRRAIVGALLAWDHDARAVAAATTPSTVIPVPRLIAPTLEDQLRGLDYPVAVKAVLLALVRNGFKKLRRKDGEMRLEFRQRGKGQPQLARVVLPEPGQIRLKVVDPGLQTKFRRDHPTVAWHTSKNALKCSLDTTSEAGAREAVDILELVSTSVPDAEATR